MTSPQHDREQLTEQIRRAVKPFAADYAYDIADAVLPVLDGAVTAAVRDALEDAAQVLDEGGSPLAADEVRKLAPAREEGATWPASLPEHEQQQIANDVTAEMRGKTPGREGHVCDNCEGIDPTSCLMNPVNVPQTAAELGRRSIEASIRNHHASTREQGGAE